MPAGGQFLANVQSQAKTIDNIPKSQEHEKELEAIAKQSLAHLIQQMDETRIPLPKHSTIRCIS